MTHKLSRYRVFAAVFLFLNASSINTGLEPMGKATWLGCIVAAVAAMGLVGVFARVCRSGNGSGGGSAVMLAAAFFSSAVLLGQFRIFVTTYNELVPSPVLIAVMLGAGALFLSRLKGHGLWRCSETVFAGVFFMLTVSFLIGVHEIKPGRLLPLWQGGAGDGIISAVKVYGSFFADLFAAVAVLSRDAGDEEVVAGTRWAVLASGIVMALFRIKCIGVIGYITSERYSFPVYALSGLQRIGSYGIHIEDIITCALAAARMVKLAVLIRFCSACIEKLTGRGGRITDIAVTAATVLASIYAIGSDRIMISLLDRQWIVGTLAFLALPLVLYWNIKRKGRA